eukprot:16436473-Heterocapsa_arctica.AAC.2
MTASTSDSIYFSDKATSINAVAIHRMNCELEALLVILHDDCKEFARSPLRLNLIKISDLEPTTRIVGLNLSIVMAQSVTQALGRGAQCLA